jgi:NAD+ synthetase
MKEITDYGKVFEALVTKTADYLVNNNIKAQILGISGGIDSTVCAAICHEVAKRIRIPLIGRSLPTKYNKENEVTTAQLVGNAFCDDFEEVPIKNPYESFLSLLDRAECGMTAIANGNIQARLRMIYLYNLASIYRGLVIDTDNLTENNLGYFTIHGDVGDFNPIGGLWKTEVFKLAEWLFKYYQNGFGNELHQAYAAKKSIELKPTAGLGITDSDLDEIGAESYEQVDSILREILAWKWLSLEKRGDTYNSIWDMRNAFLEEQQMLDTPIEVIIAVTDRHFKSEFKRKKLPIKINRDEII